MMAATGLSRAVLVQPDYYGFDNAALLEALGALEGAGRGICAVPIGAGRPFLERLHAAGVRGVRLTDLSRHCLGLAALHEAGPMAADLGWHLSLLVDPQHLDVIEASIDAVPCPVLVDHIARFRPGLSEEQQFEALLRLAERPQVFVKLSAVEFLSPHEPNHADLDPFVAHLAAVTDRLLWGTDWPHGSVTFTGAPMPDEGRLLDLLARWFPRPADRRRILVDNPARLYDFTAPAQPGVT
jgi:2-pyrone-4,6-dicarboxylate lactonase